MNRLIGIIGALAFCVSILFNNGCCIPRGLRQDVFQGHDLANAGITIRATHKMVTAFSPMISAMLKKSIPRMHLGEIVTPFLHGSVNMSSLRMNRFKAHDRFDCFLQESPTQRLRIILTGVDADIRGHLHVGSRLIQMQSTVDIFFKNISAFLGMEFVQSKDGRVELALPECLATIGHTSFNIHDPGRYKPFIPLFRGQITNHINSGVGGHICQQIKMMVDKNLNDFFKQFPVLYPLNAEKNATNGTRSDIGSALGGLLMFPGSKLDAKQREDLLNQLHLNLSLVEKPVVTKEYIESLHSGEISYKTGGRVGLQPQKLNDTFKPRNRMFYIYIADYVFNTLLMLMRRDNLIYLRFDPNTVDGFKDLLRVKCDSSFCLGAVVPEFQKYYSKHEARVIFQLYHAPALVIDKNGASLFVDGFFTLYAVKGAKMNRVLVLQVDLVVDLDMYIARGKLLGNATIRDYSARVVKRKMTVDEDVLDMLSGFTKMILQHHLNSLISRGFTVPDFAGFKLVAPNLRNIAGAFVIETDMEMDDNMLQKFTRGLIAKAS